MREASAIKFYFAKYFFLAFGMLQWLCGALLILNSVTDKSKGSAFFFFTIGLVFISLHLLFSGKLKRVAINKKRIVVINNSKEELYEWSEVKSIKMVPYFNLFRMKLKGKKNKIYFLPDQNVVPILGLFPKELELTDLLKKKIK